MAACTNEGNEAQRRNCIKKIVVLLPYRKLPPFLPPLNIHTTFDFGQTRVTERKCFLRKVFSSEESKGENDNEQFQ